MRMTGPSKQDAWLDGREKLAELVASVIEALTDAELIDELKMLESRVFGRKPDLLFETRSTTGGNQLWTFKPMVELLLRHVRGVACAHGRSREDRQQEIRWALDVSGL
jgi:hypothetical protein